MAPSDDIKDARATYSGFIGTLKWVVPVVAVVVLIVVLLIA